MRQPTEGRRASVTVEDLRREGGGITGALAVRRQTGAEQPSYRLYVQCQWLGAGYYPITIHRGRAVRVHRALEPWLGLLEGFGYLGPVIVLRDGTSELEGFRDVLRG